MSKYEIGAYAQEGEDLIIKEIFSYFEGKTIRDGGFYVDIGALHPEKISNTAIFYKRGWSGINVDATPNSMKIFNEMRPRDINLEYAVSDNEEDLIFYMFYNPAFNSFDKELSLSRKEKALNTKVIKTVTLEYILDKYLPKNREIDFLTIDVEGYDVNVLKSNNWDKYKPKVILIELLTMNLSEMLTSDVYIYLKNLGYSYCSKTIRTHFFVRNDIYQKRIK